MTQPSAAEQYLLEMINAERAASGAQPLAFDSDLNLAAEGHSAWMIATDTFSHTGSGGSTAGQRMSAAGYEFTGSWAWGENIAWATTRAPPGYQDEVQLLHTNLMNSSGHRANILSDTYREVGLSLEIGEYGGREGAFITEDFAKSGTSVFLTGVAFDDMDGDQFYDPGEGFGGLTVTAVSNTGTQYTTSTMSAGGYDLALPAGNYTVTFSGDGIAPTTMQTTIGSENVKLDLIDPAMESGTPTPPGVVPSVTEALKSDTGASSTDKLTSDPTLSGFADPDAYVTLSEGNNTLGTTTADDNGIWTFAPIGLDDGKHTIAASETDAFGNTGTAWLTFTLDTTAPGTSIDTAPASQTNSTNATFAVNGMDAVDVVSYEYKLDDTPTWTPTTSSTISFLGLSDGSHTFQVAAVDGAGNVDDTPASYTWDVSTTEPTGSIFPFTTADEFTEALYVGYFGRAGDPGGTHYWTDNLNDGYTIQQAAASFSVQVETKALYPFLADPLSASGTEIDSFISSVYAELFSRAPDPGGLNYWHDFLAENLGDPQSVGAFILTVIYGARNTAWGLDQDTIANKVHVADLTTQAFDAAGIDFGLAPSPAHQFAHTIIGEVDFSSEGVAAAENAIMEFIDTHSTVDVALVGAAPHVEPVLA